MGGVVVRHFRHSGLEAVRGLHDLAFSTIAVEHYTAAQVNLHRAALGDDAWVRELQVINLLVADEGELGLVATGGWTADGDMDAARIRKVYVHPERVRVRLGSRLVRAAESWATEAGFQRFRVFSSLTAVPFYRQLGYVEVERPGVGGPVPGVWMVRSRISTAPQ